MATDALRSQVAVKWQEAFNRLNRGEPGISGLTSYSHAWHVARESLRPIDLWYVDPSRPKYNSQELQQACETLMHCKRLPVLLEVFLSDVKDSFHLIERDIEAYMSNYQHNKDPMLVSELIRRLQRWYLAWKPRANFGTALLTSYTDTFQTMLFNTIPPTFPTAFKHLCTSTLEPSSPTQDPALWSAFESIGLVDRYESLIASVGYEYIERYVVERCEKRWGEQCLGELREWMTDRIVPWLVGTYAPGVRNTDEARTLLQGVGSRFDFHMNKTLCDLRTREIFDIIIDYPDSQGALLDLKECLQRVDQRATLVTQLRRAQRKRLLHPAAETKVILSQYVSTIKCLRIIDPPGVLLFKVADPIRRYLRERPDTIRSIVANLVGDDEGGESLLDDAEPVQPLQTAEVEDYMELNWEPEPVDAGPHFRTNKPSDIISTLVSIYDSKDLFVKELQVMLAQRLLGIQDDEAVEKERRNIEILKIRFGEAALQVCEVMLRDMTDSKRINQHVQAQKQETSDSIVHPTIISKHYWPSLENSDMVMPGQFQALQDVYAKEFTVFKPDKRLRWLSHLGTVQLSIELEDRTVDATVPPLEAAFIELFAEKPQWTVDDLRARIGTVDRAAALKALLTWVDLGVLKEERENEFVLLEKADADEAGGVRVRQAAPVLAMEAPPVVNPQEQEMEQIKIYWKFIEGMLTNLGQLPLDRIHGMMKLAPDYDRTMEQLGSLLETARKEGMLVVKDGMWRLNR